MRFLLIFCVFFSLTYAESPIRKTEPCACTHGGKGRKAISYHKDGNPVAKCNKVQKCPCFIPFHMETDVALGNKYAILTGDAFAPLYQEQNGFSIQSLLFLNVRGMLDTRRAEEVNMGLGYRQIIGNKFILGTYGFFDSYRSCQGYYYRMFTGGVEYLTVDRDVRVNIYIPDFKKHRRRRCIKGSVIDTFVPMVSRDTYIYEMSIPGVDAEVGKALDLPLKDAQLWVLGGGYYFGRSGVKAIVGPRVRMQLRFNNLFQEGSRLTVGTELQYDSPRGFNAFFKVGLRIPLDVSGRCARLRSPLEKRLNEKVIKDRTRIIWRRETSTRAPVVATPEPVTPPTPVVVPLPVVLPPPPPPPLPMVE